MTIQTSWEMMQQYREALDLAKWRKQVRAEHLEQIRLAGDYIRSMRCNLAKLLPFAAKLNWWAIAASLISWLPFAGPRLRSLLQLSVAGTIAQAMLKLDPLMH